MSNQKKIPLLESDKLFKRIRSDPMIYAHLVRIGYEDKRLKKIVFVPFDEWRPIDEGGDVPWSRVHQFTYGGAVMWDRELRICRVDDIFCENSRTPKVPYGELSFVSFNVLSEKPGGPNFKGRSAELLAAVSSMVVSHDFVLLQECPESFVDELKVMTVCFGIHLASSVTCGVLQENHKRYSRKAKDLDHVVTLSRHPISKSSVTLLGPCKPCLVCDFLAEDLRTFRVINVHLTSSMQADSESKRIDQLLIACRQSAGHAAIVGGDFNERGALKSTLLASMGLFDTADRTSCGALLTVDPATNKLCKSTVPGRMDRFLATEHLSVHSLTLVPELQLSDHHPLIARLELSDSVSVDSFSRAPPSVPATNLCVVFPWPLWAETWLRERKTDNEKWMPHLTISSGFVKESDFFRCDNAVRKVVARHLPIELTFDAPSVFRHETKSSVVLEVSSEGKHRLRLLRDELASLKLWEMSCGDGFAPHLTLFKCEHEEAERHCRRLQSGHGCLHFVCDKLCMVSGKDSPHMRVLNTVGYDMPNTGVIESILREHGSLRLVGSALLEETRDGAAAFDADDTLRPCDRDYQLSLASSDSMSLLRKTLETCGEVLLTKLVSSSHGRFLQIHTKIAGRTLDVQLLEPGVQPRSGMDLVLELVGSKRSVFALCLAEIKRALKQCGIYGQRYGFLPGYAVAIMTARLVVDEEATVDTCLGAFCARFGGPGGLRLCRVGRCFGDMSARHAAVEDLLPPHANVLRTVTRSSAAKIQRALRNGLEPQSEGLLFPFQTTFRACTPTLRCIDAVQAWFGSKFLGLILQFEVSTALSHGDSWKPECDSHWPFVYSFTVRSESPLEVIAGPLLGQLRSDFADSYGDCELHIESSRSDSRVIPEPDERP